MKNKILKKIVYTLVLSIFFSFSFYPDKTHGADTTISIVSKNETAVVGDLVTFVFELESGDTGIVSVDLVFSYDPEFLEFQDGDTKQTGLQISTTSSSFSTITKKLADKDSGELKFSASKIGGVFNQSVFFEASFKALKAGPTSLNLDKTLSKIFSANGTQTYDFNPLDFTINESSESETPDTETPDTDTTDTTSQDETTADDNTQIAINHNTIPEAVANQDLELEVSITPKEEVKEARLYFKNSIDESFAPIKMQLSEENSFRAKIPKEKVVIGELKYFFGIIDVLDTPIRYPEEDNVFFTTEILLNNDEPNILNSGSDNNLTQSIGNNQNYQANFGSSKNTATGPEENIFLLIGSVALILLFLSFKEAIFDKK